MKNKELSLLGLSKKAGKLVIGRSMVKESTKNEEVKLIIVAKDVSEGSNRWIENNLRSYGVKIIKTSLIMDEIERILKKRVGIIGITDAGFSKLLEEEIRVEFKEEYSL